MNNINVPYYSSRAQKSQAGYTEQPSDRALPSSRAGQGPGGPPPCAPLLRGSGPLSSRGVAPTPLPLLHVLLAACSHSPSTSSGVHPLPSCKDLCSHCAHVVTPHPQVCKVCRVRKHVYRWGGGGELIQSTTQDPTNLLVCRHWPFTHCRDGVRKITFKTKVT